MYSARKRKSMSKEVPSHPIAFLGDTLIFKWMEQGHEIWDHLYAPLDAGNYGTTNDSTLVLIEKLEREEIPLEHTRCVVLMIGATDLRFRIREKVVLEQIRKIILLLQQSSPGVKILLLGIMPREGDKDMIASIQETNDLLSQLENGFTIRWLDMWSHFVEPRSGKIIEDLFEPDGVTLSTRGYQVWANAMATVFEDCLPK